MSTLEDELNKAKKENERLAAQLKSEREEALQKEKLNKEKSLADLKALNALKRNLRNSQIYVNSLKGN